MFFKAVKLASSVQACVGSQFTTKDRRAACCLFFILVWFFYVFSSIQLVGDGCQGYNLVLHLQTEPYLCVAVKTHCKHTASTNTHKKKQEKLLIRRVLARKLLQESSCTVNYSFKFSIFSLNLAQQSSVCDISPLTNLQT